MKTPILALALVATLGLAACERTVVTPVPVSVPGPAGRCVILTWRCKSGIRRFAALDTGTNSNTSNAMTYVFLANLAQMARTLPMAERPEQPTKEPNQ